MRATARIGIAAMAAGVMLLLKRRDGVSGNCSCTGLRSLIDELPHCGSIQDRLDAIERAFVATFGYPLAVLLFQCDRVWVRHHSPGFELNEEDLTDAVFAISSGLLLRRVRYPGDESSYFLPLTTAKGPVGALVFRANRQKIGPRWPLIRSFASQTALALLRSSLEDEAQNVKALSETDQFRKTLLDSIAHNVRTPLASIIGVLSTLQEDQALLDGAVRRELLDTARQEADRLNRLLGNLLDLSRLESGSVRVRADPCDIHDVIGAAIEQLGPRACNRRVQVRIDLDLPLVRMDFVLIVQVIVNLLDNALKYSPEDRPILIEVKRDGPAAAFCIADDGDGIPAEDLARVFEKFNRGGRTGETGGIGLGLSICRGLIEAHQGTIAIERRNPRGTAITFTLPLSPVEKDGTAA
jgi:two-component system sensor histidine kinase KdpD